MLLETLESDDLYDIYCVFKRNKRAEYPTQVLEIRALDAAVTEIECELPAIADGNPADSLTVDVRIYQAIVAAGETYQVTSVNSMALSLIPLPVISRVEPQNVFNIL